MNIHKSYYETLYSRPVVALSGYCAKYDLPDSLYAYLAYGGTTGSAKDALAEGMLALATEKGLLQPGPDGDRVFQRQLCRGAGPWPAPTAATR